LIVDTQVTKAINRVLTNNNTDNMVGGGADLRNHDSSRARQNSSKTHSPASCWRDDFAQKIKTVSAFVLNGNGNLFVLILEMMSTRQHQRIFSD
jgi:hypothetical protein